MGILDESVRKRLIAKFGPNINLEGRSEVVNELLREITEASAAAKEPGYDKQYTEGYNKEGYSKADYVRYDKTNLGSEVENVMNVIRPELEKLIVDKLRTPPKRQRPK